jgi:hypothetical protein
MFSYLGAILDIGVCYTRIGRAKINGTEDLSFTHDVKSTLKKCMTVLKAQVWAQPQA